MADPANPKLYARVQAEARRKFDVYPSAYANGWLVQEYKRRGGTYKGASAGRESVNKGISRVTRAAAKKAGSKLRGMSE